MYLLLMIFCVKLFDNDALPSLDAHGSQEIKTVLVLQNDSIHNSAEHSANSANSANAERIPLPRKQILRRTSLVIENLGAKYAGFLQKRRRKLGRKFGTFCMQNRVRNEPQNGAAGAAESLRLAMQLGLCSERRSMVAEDADCRRAGTEQKRPSASTRARQISHVNAYEITVVAAAASRQTALQSTQRIRQHEWAGSQFALSPAAAKSSKSNAEHTSTIAQRCASRQQTAGRICRPGYCN